jgi:eukaryotic-like serine/threonine-protein kinase
MSGANPLEAPSTVGAHATPADVKFASSPGTGGLSIPTLLPQGADLSRDEMLAVVRADQLRRWPRGEPVLVESYVRQVPALGSDPEALLDLIYSEVLVREQCGEQPGVEEYVRRFPAHENQIRRQFAIHAALASEALTPDLPLTTRFAPGGAAEEDTNTAAGAGVRYQPVRYHARGGLGEVFVARDQELNRDVALKRMQLGCLGDADSRRRFLLEAEITGRLEHPGIVPVYGLGQDAEGRPCYAMRFIRGETLQDAILRFHKREAPGRDPGERSLAFRQLLAHFVAACNTVAYAHSRGVLHRDLKPANIMLGQYGETIVVDWGLAKRLDQPATEPAGTATSDKTADPKGTQPGSVAGTPVFMSPEQASGRWDQVGPPSDVYSLGATLFVLLTGKLPFEGDVFAVLEQARHGEFPPPRQVKKDTPAALNAVCLKAMARDPLGRYGSAKQLADDIEHWLADEPVSAFREPLAQRLARFGRRHRTWVQAGAAALLLVTVVSVAATVVVRQAWQSEGRALRIDLLKSELQNGLDASAWDPGHVEQLEKYVHELAELDPAQADNQQNRVYEAFGRYIAGLLHTPTLDKETLRRVDDFLALLDRKSPRTAAKLHQERERRVRQWQPLFELTPSYKTAGAVFDLSRIRVEHDSLGVPKSDGDALPFVLTQEPCRGNVQLEALFGPSWEAVPAVGLLLNAGDANRYQFLVTVPQYTPRGNAEDLGRWPSLETVRKLGERVKVQVLRNNQVLRTQTLTLPPGPLKLRASRVEERLTFQVNAEPEMVFDDPFALSTSQPGFFGLFWPEKARLVTLTAQRQALPAQPTPLEQGDQLYGEGKFADALSFYQAQEAVADRPEAVDQARYKEALCLLELARGDEAARLLEALLPREGGPKASRWAMLAGCRLWLLRLEQRQFPAAEQLLEVLSTKYSFDDLVVLVPAQLRQGILGYYRMSGGWWRVAFKNDDSIERIQRALRIEELLNESDYERRMTRWRLCDAYRAAGNRELALTTLRDLLEDRVHRGPTPLPADERIALLRDLVWLLIEEGQPQQAVEEMNRWLALTATDEYRPLLIERARARIALKQWDEAEKDVEEFFKDVSRDRLSYTEFADACLVRGFLREERGDRKGAEEAWRQGLLRDWPGGLPPLPADQLLTGVAMRRRADAITFSGLLSSLTGELTPAEAKESFEMLTSGTGASIEALRVLANRTFTPEFMRDVIVGTYRSERGRKFTRQMVYRQISLPDYIMLPMRLLMTEAMHVGAMPTGWTPELEELAWRGGGELMAAYESERINDKHVALMLKIWRGRSDPSDDWQTLGQAFEPDLRVPGAFLFGCRFVVLEKPEVAAEFFKEVLERAPADSPYRRLAKAELDKLPKK